MELTNTITDVPGVIVGNAENPRAITGCTVLIFKNGAIAGIDQRGGAPGTRETDLLRPTHLVEKVHAILLAGGSAYGLDAAGGVMKFLEEQNIGFDTQVARVPIVPSAILFDLNIGDPNIRPNAEMGYQACVNATNEPVRQGNVGAGAGATVGKILGINQAMKSGLGTSSVDIGNGIIVGAIVIVNAFGDVVNPKTGEIIAGARTLIKGPIKIGESGYFGNTLSIMKSFIGKKVLNFAMRQNTVIGVVATNAKLSKVQANKVAQMAQNGLVRTILPANTMFDGDTIFALSTGKRKADINIIGAFAAKVLSSAIINAIQYAKPAGGLPAASGKQ